MKRPLLSAVLLACPFIVRGQEATPPAEPAPAVEPAKPSALEEAIGKTQAAFVETFNKGDAAAVAGYYDEAATYTSDSGKYMDGRAAIAAGMTEYFKLNPGAKLEIQPQSVREVTADVAVASGIAVFNGSAGAVEVTRYKAIYAKRGDAWRIVELNENVVPPAERGQVELKALEWLVGSWRDKVEGEDVTTVTAWTKSARFLRRSITVNRNGAEVMQATEIIGWDPVNSEIHSWVFDSEGGFGEGIWRQEGNRWVVRSTSTLPTGQTASALNIFTPVDAGSYTWESTNRELDGEVLASLEKVTVERAAAAPAPEQPVTK